MPASFDERGALVLKAEGLSKVIRRRPLVQEFSIALHAGEVCGFLGPNGAGKTTTLRMITGLSRPTTGRVWLAGYDLHKDRRRALLHIGAIVETPGLFPYMTGYQNVYNMARLHPTIPAEHRQERVREVLALVGLSDDAQQRVRTYSLGMKQRLGLALALLGSPALIVLDEPTNGLDPFGVRDLRALINKLSKERNIAFLISSHQLAEIEQTCTKLIFIDKGQVIAQGTQAELSAGYGSLEEAFISIIQRKETKASG